MCVRARRTDHHSLLIHHVSRGITCSHARSQQPCTLPAGVTSKDFPLGAALIRYPACSADGAETRCRRGGASVPDVSMVSGGRLDSQTPSLVPDPGGTLSSTVFMSPEANVRSRALCTRSCCGKKSISDGLSAEMIHSHAGIKLPAPRLSSCAPPLKWTVGSPRSLQGRSGSPSL